MVGAKNLKKSVFECVLKHLSPLGWKRRQPGIFTVRLNEETLDWLGLNTGRGYGPGILEVNPVVGVVNERLERLVAELMEIKYTPAIPPSVCGNIGYFTPEKTYKKWMFQEGEDSEPLVVELVAAVETYGRLFMQRNADLHALYLTIRDSAIGYPHMAQYRIPAAGALLGKTEEAEEFLGATLREMESRTDQAAELFRKFAANLRSYVRNAAPAGTA